MSALVRRYVRVGLATVVLGCLLVVILVSRAHMFEEDQRLTHTMSTLAWKVSQTIFEAQRFELDLIKFRNREVDAYSVMVSAEVFWSRIDVMRRTDVVDGTILRDKLDEIELYLSEIEEVLLGDSEVLRERAREIHDVLEQWQKEFREIWIGERERSRELVIASVARNSNWSAALSEYLIFACVFVLALYMTTELALSHRAHDRERALRQAETQANLAKSAFLANVSHEVRTPLNGVIGLAQELEETELDASQQQLVSIIRSSGDLLLATINDVLDLSKIESGKLVIEERDFDLPRTLEQCLALHERQAARVGLPLIVHLPDDLPRMVRGDAMRMSQVINNLLSNALKFTTSGQIDVFVRHAVDETNSVKLSIAVRDTGIGISKDAQERIFAPFVQAEADTTRRFGGTGLGLTISRNICRHLGGDLTVASMPGQGSTFTARFTLKNAVAATASTRTDAIETAPLAKHPAEPEVNRGVVPFDPAVRQADTPEMQDRTCQMPKAEGAAAPDFKPQGTRFLVVDDSETNRFVLRRYLRGFDAEVHESESGEDALEKIRGGPFDIIFMDVQMPGIDGAEATRRVRSYEAEHDVKASHIVAATANVMSHQIEEYMAAGMNDVLPKPIRKTEFIELMQRLGHKRVA